MELKDGMYVRTKSGLIAKYIGFEKDEEDNEYSKYNFNGKIYWYYEYYNDYVYEEDFEEWFEESVIKASYNIIDIIEVGDYVNGELVVRIEKDPFIKGQINLWTNTTTTNYWGDIGLSPIIDKNIKSIVTKEQFESMQYRLGE